MPTDMCQGACTKEHVAKGDVIDLSSMIVSVTVEKTFPRNTGSCKKKERFSFGVVEGMELGRSTAVCASDVCVCLCTC